MAKQDNFRSQLQNKLFTPFGKTAILYTPTTVVTYDSYGNRDEDTTAYTASDITVLDYDIIDNRKTHEMWGDLQVGERIAIAPYTVSLDVDYYVQIGGVNYKINDIEKPALPDQLVNIFKLSKTTDTITVTPTETNNFLFMDGNNVTFIDGNNFTFIN